MIGVRASYVHANEALSYVAGACICNDVSEREYQMERGGTWAKGKGCPTFGPLGPWLVTLDEAGDLNALDLWLDVNGTRMQTGTTARMIFDPAQLVAYVSHFMMLEPGDVIITGTPPGVGMARKPPRFLKSGDVMTLGITGLGEQRQEIVAFDDWTAKVAAGSRRTEHGLIFRRDSPHGAMIETPAPVTAPETSAIRHDWTVAEIKAIHDLPLLDLVYRAAAVHRAHNDPADIQRASLLSIKTGGCPEDCAYCPQSAHHKGTAWPASA